MKLVICLLSGLAGLSLGKRLTGEQPTNEVQYVIRNKYRPFQKLAAWGRSGAIIGYDGKFYPDQYFTMQNVPGVDKSRFRIRSEVRGKSIACQKGGDVFQWGTYSPDQLFRFEHVDGPWYRIKCQFANRKLFLHSEGLRSYDGPNYNDQLFSLQPRHSISSRAQNRNNVAHHMINPTDSLMEDQHEMKVGIIEGREAASSLTVGATASIGASFGAYEASLELSTEFSTSVSTSRHTETVNTVTKNFRCPAYTDCTYYHQGFSIAGVDGTSMAFTTGRTDLDMKPTSNRPA